jgi:hypothetical protein
MIHAVTRAEVFSCFDHDPMSGGDWVLKGLRLLIKLPAEDDLIKVNAQIVSVTERGIGCKFIDLSRKCEGAIQQTFVLAKHTLPIL